MAKYINSFSSGGKKTSTANQVISFERARDDVFLYNDTDEYNSVEYLSFETFETACNIKLNDEKTIHWIDVNNKVIFSDIMITKITIITPNVEYYYTAFSSK